jgi:hypothetical protein
MSGDMVWGDRGCQPPMVVLGGGGWGERKPSETLGLLLLLSEGDYCNIVTAAYYRIALPLDLN